MPAGRPTKYRPEYCEAVIKLGKEGKSPAQMAAHFDVARSTIDEWAENHEEFSEAYARALAHCQNWWENKGQAALDTRDFNSAVWAKSMSARFRDDYTERKEHTGAGGGAISVSITSDDDAL